MGSSHQPLPADANRRERIQRVVNECLSREVEGEAISIDEIGSRNEDLMPELAEALRRAVFISNARQRAKVVGPVGFQLAGYEVVREIRRGGQGVVFEAVQRSTGRTVAIKWMRDDSLGDSIDQLRFEREIRILAQLNHPNIVTIHDSGVTPAGGSYFVMNYIEGTPLDEYVERMSPKGEAPASRAHDEPTRSHGGAATPAVRAASKPLISGGVADVRDGLALFQKVCEAVHAAHLRGIIHRDLKPSNIRVDARGEPHVLDFGLAKVSDLTSLAGVLPVEAGGAASARLGGAAEYTQSGQFIGSLPWASPEQVEGRTDLIDIRTDVYSLGVVLFQMLTGRFPYPVLGHVRDVMDHVTRTPPARPRSLRPGLDDEVETIVLKCLAKERERRYQSAGELARDVDRYLSGDAIEAKRDSFSYVLRKQFQRHRVPLGIAAAFILLVFAGLGVSVYAWRQALAESERARHAEQLQSIERSRAEKARLAEADQRRIAVQNAEQAWQEAAEKSAINEFLQTILGAANPRDARDRNITVRAALDEAAKQLDARSPAQSPRVEAAVRTTLGQTYRSLGEYVVAEAQLRQAVGLYESAAPDSLDAAGAWNSWGLALLDLHRVGEAIEKLQRAVAIARALPEKNNAELAVLLNSLGNAQFESHDYKKAESNYREALTIQRARFGNAHRDVAMTLDNLGMLLTQTKQVDEAEPLLREALATQRQILDPDHPHIATTLGNLADVLSARDQDSEAEQLLRESLRIHLAVQGESHPHSAIAMVRLAKVLMELHQETEAEELLRRALAIRRKDPEGGWSSLAANLGTLAELLARTNRLGEAVSMYREVLDIRQARLGPEHLDTAEAMNNLAGMLTQQDKLDEALELHRATLRILEKSLPADDIRLAAARNNLANVLSRQSRFDEAEPLHREILRALQARYPAGHAYVARSMCNLAKTLAAQKKYDEGEGLYRSAVEMQRRLHAPNEHFDTADALGDLAKLQSSMGHDTEAEASLREAFRILQKVTPPKHMTQISATSRLAECVAKQSKFEEAERLWLAAYEMMAGNPAVTDKQRQVMVAGIVECYDGAGRVDDAARWRERLKAPESK